MEEINRKHKIQTKPKKKRQESKTREEKKESIIEQNMKT